MARTKLKGQAITVSIAGTAVASSTNCSVNITANTSSVATKDDSDPYFENPETTNVSWDISNESFVTTVDNLKTLVNAWVARTEVTVLVQRSVATLVTGSAYITNIQVTAPNDGYATISLSMAGTGELSLS